jgi:hypothetical protein
MRALPFVLALAGLSACSLSAPKQPTVQVGGTQLGLFVNGAPHGRSLFRSKSTIDEMLDFASSLRADALFVHAYIDDRRFFEAGPSTDPEYRAACERAGTDLFGYLLDSARGRGMKVYAWVNCFSITKSAAARHPLLKAYGLSVLTRDQNGRPYDGVSGTEPADEYYMRDNLMWLEPGDPRVRTYLRGIFTDLLSEYTNLEGLQLDFVRYPVDPPFVPGGRYLHWGYSPGYGTESVARFRKMFGFVPSESEIGMEKSPGWNGANKALSWDRWRRGQVTSFVREVKRLSGRKPLCASVFAYADRVYFSGFQDWRLWLEDGLLDFAIPMNYTIDTELAHHLARQQEGSFPGKIWPALGAYVMKKDPGLLEKEVADLMERGVAGFAVFDFSSLQEDAVLARIIRDRKGPDPSLHP